MEYLNKVLEYVKAANEKLNFNEFVNQYDHNINMIHDFLLLVEKKNSQ